ncbi:MAG: sigma-54 dependent transcriptional regulator [Thermodesulfovibrionales bacterium]|nr:sigma-54 dependent transcriptional regulator [Thermodesulfovibrionales bacterium]MDP3110994.1 sigma-54 dependent transcriptional regulator [Thermodesulfovibrionales bacterium]
MAEAKILVIDDEKLLRWSLQQNLSKEGYTVITAEKGMEGLNLFKEETPDVTLLDIHLPDVSGITVLQGIKEINKDALAIMITAFGDIQTAVKTIKLGAYDFVEKPFNVDKLKILVAKALETVSLRKEVSQFRSQLSLKYGFDSIIGQSEEMQKIFEIIKKIAKSDATTIMLQGESGTGKDLVAKVIHYQSRRSNKPFMEINCTALPETLIESELFGHEKGAFTDAKAMKKGLFELADGGSIYLDEIGDMKPSTQAKLLKIIESKMFKRIGGVKDITVDVRIIAATNKNLAEEVKSGNFREDLYYRLKVIPVLIPPLRDRPSDISALAKYFINEFNREFKKNLKGISKEAEKYFKEYQWPGNVRELKNIIERAMILESEEDFILPEHLPIEFTSKEVALANVRSIDIKIPPGGLDIEEVEKELIRQALDITRGNQTKSSRLLNITRDALRYRMQKFGFLPEKP